MSKVSGYTHTQSQMDHYANQCNPNSNEYQSDMDNHANQCNPNYDDEKDTSNDEKQE